MAASHTRLQQTYDHRLRDLVRDVSDPDIVAEFGVPRSTALGWLRGEYRPVVTAEILDMERVRRWCTARGSVALNLLSSHSILPWVGNTMPYRYPKRSQYKYTKKPYRIRNWPAYETALRKRGELTLWFSEEAIHAWHAPASGKPGGQRVYSDLAVQTALTVRTVYHLGLRQAEGFLRWVSALLNLKIRIPDHSTLSRRSMTLPSVQICPTDSRSTFSSTARD